MLPKKFDAAASRLKTATAESTMSFLNSIPPSPPSTFPRRGSESTQRFARQLFRRPSEPCWSANMDDAAAMYSESTPPNIPQQEEVTSLPFSVSSFGDWLDDSASASPLTTPEDTNFGGHSPAATNHFEKSFHNSLKDGVVYQYGQGHYPRSTRGENDAIEACASGYINSHQHSKRTTSASRRDSASRISQQIDINLNRGDHTTDQGRATKGHHRPVASVPGDLPHWSAPKPFAHHRKSSWVLQGTTSSQVVFSSISSSKGAVINSNLEVAGMSSPSSLYHDTPPSVPREMSQSSVSSANVSEYSNTCSYYGAAAKTRHSPKTSATSNFSLASEGEGDILQHVNAPKTLVGASEQVTVNSFAKIRHNTLEQHSPGPTSGRGSLTSSEVRDDSSRRARIIMEIITTEETYAKCLEELVDIYVSPSAGTDGSGQPPIPLAERRQVFTNIEGILEFHRSALLPALKTAAEPLIATCGAPRSDESADQFQMFTARISEDVANTFERHAAFFRMYTSYVNNVDCAQRRVQAWQADASSASVLSRFGGGRLSASASMLAWDIRNSISLGVGHGNAGSNTSFHDTPLAQMPMSNYAAESSKAGGAIDMPLQGKDRKRIRAFLLKARNDPRHSQISLEAYLLLPVQRIPRYRLLFEELVRFCPPERLQNPVAISNALDSISGIAMSMNESKRQSEMDRRLLLWQERIRGQFPSPLVQPHRKLVKDGQLTLKRIESRFAPNARSSSLGSPHLHGRRNSAAGRMSRTSVGSTHAGGPPSSANMYADKGMEFFDLGYQLETPNDLLEIDHVDDCLSRPVEVLLCNDIVVIVEEASIGSGTNGIGILRAERSSTNVNGENAASPKRMDLVAVMRMCSDIRIVEETVLRLVDPVHVIYLETSGPTEANAWRVALECVSQRASHGTIASPAHATASSVPSQKIASKKCSSRALRQVKSHQVLSKVRTSVL